MIQPYTKQDLQRAEQVVQELHGLRGYNEWAERIAKEIAATREQTIGGSYPEQRHDKR